jgi:DMSO reductase anchor subunit
VPAAKSDDFRDQDSIMHPAYSVILFTTASGAGYGLLTLVGFGALLGGLPPDPVLGLAGVGLALALISAGLLSSTAHLGHPERAWRALSQWPTSWLSREGVLAIATFVPVVLFGFAWGVLGHLDFAARMCGVLGAVLSMATVFATGMIYASLTTIRQWSNVWTVPVYLSLSLATGGILLGACASLLTEETRAIAVVALALLGVAGLLKHLYWRSIDQSPPPTDAGTATGLGRFGPVRQLEAPHTQANFVMREMGYTVARRHVRRLRRLVSLFLFAFPAALVLLAFLSANRDAAAIGNLAWIAATASACFGVAIERWLFFAEAEHVVMAYYGGRKPEHEG